MREPNWSCVGGAAPIQPDIMLIIGALPPSRAGSSAHAIQAPIPSAAPTLAANRRFIGRKYLFADGSEPLGGARAESRCRIQLSRAWPLGEPLTYERGWRTDMRLAGGPRWPEFCASETTFR